MNYAEASSAPDVGRRRQHGLKQRIAFYSVDILVRIIIFILLACSMDFAFDNPVPGEFIVVQVTGTIAIVLTLISFVIVCIFFYSSLRSGVRRTVPLDWLSVTLEVIITIAIGLAVGFDKYLRTYGANPFDQSLPPNKYLWEGMPAAHTMFPKLVAALVFQILLVGWSGAILCCRRRSAASQCHHEVYEQQQQQQQQEFNMDGMASGFHDSTPSLLKEAATDTKPIDVYQVQLPNEPPPAYYPDDKPPREPKLAKG